MEEERFFGGLPRDGVWTMVGLRRGQFLAILLISTAAFLITDGPLWRDLRASHFARIGWSYLVILPLVVASLWRNAKLTGSHLFGATVLIALIKLVITAVLLVALALML